MRAINKTEKEWVPIFPLSRILFIVILIFLFYFLFYFNYFHIRKVVVVGAKSISDSEIEKETFSFLAYRRFYIFPGKNIFLVNKPQIKKNLKKKFTRLEQFEISRIYPDVLKIKIYEKEPKVIWQSKNESYFIDANGVVYSEMKNYELEESTLPEIRDKGEKEVKLFENVLFLKHINFIHKLNEQLPKEGIKISSFSLPAKLADEIHVKTEEEWEIYFSVEKEAEAQIANLKLVLADEIKERRGMLEYVDLRVANWVYYKIKTAGVPRQNMEVKKEIKNQE